MKKMFEIFSAGCPACENVIAQIEHEACPSCEVSVLDMKDPAVVARATALGVKKVPAIAVNGELAACCGDGGVDLTTLRKAGLGTPS